MASESGTIMLQPDGAGLGCFGKTYPLRGWFQKNGGEQIKRDDKIIGWRIPFNKLDALRAEVKNHEGISLENAGAAELQAAAASQPAAGSARNAAAALASLPPPSDAVDYIDGLEAAFGPETADILRGVIPELLVGISTLQDMTMAYISKVPPDLAQSAVQGVIEFGLLCRLLRTEYYPMLIAASKEATARKPMENSKPLPESAIENDYPPPPRQGGAVPQINPGGWRQPAQRRSKR